ncbi:hypothetical protein Q604_UNBC16742G0001, partial [human gut metagenome]
MVIFYDFNNSLHSKFGDGKCGEFLVSVIVHSIVLGNH